MAVKKSELRDFLDNKIKVQEEAHEKAVINHIHAVIDPIIDLYLSSRWLENVERVSDRLRQDLRRSIDTFDGVLPYELGDKYIFELNIISDIKKKIKGDIRLKVTNHLNPTPYASKNKHKDYKCDPLNHAVEQLERDMLAFNEKKAALKILRKETSTIIDIAGSGDRALKDLITAGLDMSEFKPTVNLPAVVKLSVAPCLLTGECEE